MAFDNILREDVVILDESGNKTAEVKASVQKDKILFKDNGGVLVRENFIIERKLPSGEIEKYRVLDCHFIKSFGTIPSMYEIGFEKIGVHNNNNNNNNNTSTIGSIHITGGINNIFSGSHGNTINTSKHQITELRNAIKASNLPSEDEKEANEIIDAIESEINSDNCKKSVVKSLVKSLPQIDTITSICANLLTFLQ